MEMIDSMTVRQYEVRSRDAQTCVNWNEALLALTFAADGCTLTDRERDTLRRVHALLNYADEGEQEYEWKNEDMLDAFKQGFKQGYYEGSEDMNRDGSFRLEQRIETAEREYSLKRHLI